MEIIGRQGVYVALEDDRIEKIRLVVMDRNNELLNVKFGINIFIKYYKM